ncbi:SurA N-terminal domain-containing protein [Halomonas llamarensis]|uniref:Periplasmic chaperone PpiD n=1 Tax=Halomonas llamarensis TaxID=2945104 RepID=A0ABT0SSQ2_9GAMM|nr:SurA N-terminal domain-containing protein [Halomonas llamarensis]MCL7930852.1 SurA N-terminal domain-containing protein [Halomonas llamarensis]
MLQSIRDGSRSWGAKIIIGVMVAAMALFGVESLFGLFGSDPDEVASVNGEPIVRQEVELEVQRAMRSGQVPPEQERALRSEMLDQLITQRLLTQYAEEGSFYVSDDQLDQLIVNLPEFQDQEGVFSAEQFRNRLARAGYTPLSFRQELRTDVKRRQLQQGLAFSDFTLETEQQRLAELQRQQRSFRYDVLSAEGASRIDVSQEELERYYNENAERFERLEQVRLEYVVIDREEMAADVEVNEAELREAWREQNQNADRRVAHIMISYGDERTREQAQVRAEEALDALDSVESFADTAARYSDDTASAEDGGDLGEISRGFFGEAFDEVAFSLGEGEISSAVEMDDAFHIIQVQDIDRPAFEEQRDRLRQDVAMREVDDEFNQRVQQLIDESFAAEDLQSVADDIGLTLQESDWLARGEGRGVLSEPGVMEAAFSQDVLEERYNSEVIELDNDRRMVLRVAEHRDATVLPLEQVREEAKVAVRARKQQQALVEEAKELLADPESEAIEWVEANRISREADSTVPRMVVQAAFRMPHPESGESTYRYVELPEGVAIIALDNVRDGDVDEQAERFVAQMAEQLRAQSVIQGLIDDLRSNAEIERR